jgi:serine/threonine-protein kinase RsbW
MGVYRVPATLDHIEGILDAIETEAAEHGFDRVGISRIRLACEEILVNVANYAYHDEVGEVTVTSGPAAGREGISVAVEDRGIPFDPLAQVPPGTLDLPLSERPIGGLGIHLILAVMDEVHYTRDGDKNVLTMVKYR